MKVKSESEVAQSCLTLSDHVDCSPPGSSAHGIFQARILEWGAIAFSRRLARGPSSGLKSPDEDQSKKLRSRWPGAGDRAEEGQAGLGQQQLLTLAVVIGWT